MSVRNKAVSIILAVLLLAYPCFSWYLPKTAYVVVSSVLVVFILIISLDYTKFRLTCMGFGILWIPFSIMLMASASISSGGIQMTALLMIFYATALFFLISWDEWPQAVFWVLLIMTLIHATATIVFYILPAAYTPIKTIFLSDYLDTRGYKSALTNHYSYNGDFLGIGLVLSTCYLLFRPRRGFNRFIQWTTCAFVLFALIICSKRAHLAFSVSTIVLVYISLSRSSDKLMRATAILFITFIVVVMLAPYIPGLAETVDRFASSAEATNVEDLTSSRTFLWRYAIDGWLRNPYFGNGWLSYEYWWPSGRVTVIAHNEVLNLLYGVGIIGTLFFVILAAHSILASYNALCAVIDEKSNAVSLASIYSYASLFGVQVFLLIYGCTTGELLAKPITFVPYLMGVFSGYALKTRVQKKLFKVTAKSF